MKGGVLFSILEVPFRLDRIGLPIGVTGNNFYWAVVSLASSSKKQF
jgi:hypothetical protein